MRIKKRLFFELYFPLVLAGCIGQGASLIDTYITVNGRWLLVFILFAFLLIRKEILQGLPTLWMLNLFLYLIWCAFTMLWSESFLLSFTKVGAAFLMVITMISAGMTWVKKFDWSNGLNCFFLLAIFAFLTGVLDNSATDSTRDLYLFQGLTFNSNYFGCLQWMIFPFLLWNSYKYRHRTPICFIFCVLIAYGEYLLFISHSRSSFLAMLCASCFFILSLNLKHKTWITSIISVLLIFGVCFSDQLLLPFESFFHKRSATVLQSRYDQWNETHEKAMLGGLWGGGYGVSIGAEAFTLDGLTLQANHYGREKGNSQLAIIEETGFIGLGIYVLLLLSYFKKMLGFYLRLQGDKKVMVGLLIGSIIGMIAQSAFEGWWGAPGAPEFAYFWGLIGISFGCRHVFKRKLYEKHAGMEAFSQSVES